MSQIEVTAAELNALRAVESEEGASLSAEEIGNVAHHRFGNGDDAEAAVAGLVARGLLSNKLDFRRYVLTPIGRWVLGEVSA